MNNYSPKYSTKLRGVSYSLMLCKRAVAELCSISGANIFQNSIASISVLAILPAMKSTSKFRFLWSTLSMTFLRIIVLSFLRSITKPVSESGFPFTVTMRSKLWPCQFSLAHGPNISSFFSLLQLGLNSLCAALKCSCREM